ncbi:helix-turn-helix domain-containing protein [Streptomyces thermodiastaticus]|uniref:helix-turn-helix domain-containing protein n=1 Tax=Streptomyces thermodiastaticus TaxID=44061 RepID=UPI00167B6656|nr:helix-turn-helix domain-containing protein [Streptomyces thermodiastaticus]MCE7548570.1 helix-turn-helix domain-containing protein [Streptomyces thermodiastaticus]
MSAPKYLTTNEVAARYRTAPSTVRYWRHIGYIPGGVKRGRKVLYNVAILDAWDAEQAQAGGAAA